MIDDCQLSIIGYQVVEHDNKMDIIEVDSGNLTQQLDAACSEIAGNPRGYAGFRKLGGDRGITRQCPFRHEI